MKLIAILIFLMHALQKMENQAGFVHYVNILTMNVSYIYYLNSFFQKIVRINCFRCGQINNHLLTQINNNYCKNISNLNKSFAPFNIDYNYNFNQYVKQINVNNNFIMNKNIQLKEKNKSKDAKNNKKNKNNNNINAKPGDWFCSKCDNLNFAFRTICNRCHNPKFK